MSGLYLEIFTWIGIIWVFSKVLEFIKELYIILNGTKNIQTKYGKGCWALITGATDGIGKGFVQQLAAQDVNICLIIRNKEKAENLVNELKKTGTKSSFKIVVADLNQSAIDQTLYEKIYQQVKSLDIGLLINNAGVAHMNKFELLSEEQIREMINVNCFPIALLSRKIVPLLLQRKNKSAIINLASFAAVNPIPYCQVYSGTKAFDDYFSRSLNGEYSHKLDIMSLRPLFVTTPMSHYIKTQGAINIDQCAKGCLERLGLTNATHGFIFHRIQGLLTSAIPEIIRSYMLTNIQRKTVENILRDQQKQKQQ